MLKLTIESLKRIYEREMERDITFAVDSGWMVIPRDWVLITNPPPPAWFYEI